MRKREQGFTLVEVIIAIIVLTIGLLGLVTSAALVTRMIARGQRSAEAATFAAQQMEKLRVTACTSQASGSAVLKRGSTVVDSTWWRYVDAGNKHWRAVLRTKYLTEKNRWRTDSLETEISCLF